MAPIGKLLWATTALPYLRFVQDTRQPEAAQRRVWQATWSEIRRAPFWRARLGKSSRSTPPLRELEITSYPTYRAALERSFHTGTSELSGRRVIFWAESGGTTGTPKLFPLTPHYRRQFQQTTPPLLHGLVRRFPRLLSQPLLYLVEAMPQQRSPSGVDVGYISSFNYRNIPPLLQRHYALPPAVLRDAATLVEWGPLYVLASDLSAMFAITPASLVQLAARIRANLDRYWPILEGRVRPPAPLPMPALAAGRLAQLRRALRAEPFCFKDVWPALQLICCWKSAACAVQLRTRLAPYLQGRVPVVDATYSATEGWMNVPLSTDGVGGPIHPGGHVMEFFPAGDEPQAGSLLAPWQLEAGRDYEVVLTTSMGLIRYRLFDIVHCSGFFNAAPIIAFHQKAGNEISLGLVRVSEAQLLAAMEAAGLQPPGQWFFAPAPTGEGVALYCDGEDRALHTRLAAMEQHLRQSNKYYCMDVEQGYMQSLRLEVLPPDHPAWGSAAHRAQQKPKILRQSAPDDSRQLPA